MNSLADPRVAEILERLHRAADAQRPQISERLASMGDEDQGPHVWPQRMKDFYLPVSREQGRFLYQTVRAIRARRVIEFGSSFGVSTIYLAAGIRDVDGGSGSGGGGSGAVGRGLVIGSELVEEKAETANANLAAAGLGDVADIRTGDARSTLLDPGGPVDLVLLDGGPSLYLEVLRGLVPHLRTGAVVIADNIADSTADSTDGSADDLHPYATWVRSPDNGFVSSSITLKGGTEYSVWIGG